MAWRHYQLLTDKGIFQVPHGVSLVGIAAVGPGGCCVSARGGLGGGGGGGFAYGVRPVSGGEKLTGFVVDTEGSRFEVLDAKAGGDSVDERGGAGGLGVVTVPEREALPWVAKEVATGGHGGVGQRSGEKVAYGGGGGMGSFYGEGGNGGDGELVGVASMFGHGGGGGLGGAGGASVTPRAMEFIDRLSLKDAGSKDYEYLHIASGPSGGGGGGVLAGGASRGGYGYMRPKHREEFLGGPGGGGGSFGPGDPGGVFFTPERDEKQMGRLLGMEVPGKGGAGIRSQGGGSRTYLGKFFNLYKKDPSLPEAKDSTEKPAQVRRCTPSLGTGVDEQSASGPVIFFSSRTGEGRTAMAPYLALACRQLDGGGGSGANLSGAGHGGPGGGGGGAGRVPGFTYWQGQGGLAGHGGYGGGGGGGATIYHLAKAHCVECLPAGDGGVGGGGGGGGYHDGKGNTVLAGAGTGGPGGGGGGGPEAQGGQGFFIVYW